MVKGKTRGQRQDGVPRPAIDVIKDIQAGSVHPHTLTAEARRACVEYLGAEGYPAAATAAILKVNERTIRRDWQAIRETNAVERDPKLIREMVGRLIWEAENTTEHIRRTTRDKEAQPGDRIDGELACWRILRELVDALQRLGYLPTAAVQVRADLRHSVAPEAPSYEELQVQLERVEALGLQSGSTGEQLAHVRQLREVVNRFAIAEKVEAISSEVDKENTDEQ